MTATLRPFASQDAQDANDPSRALTATLARAAIQAGRRGDAASASAIVRGLLAVQRDDQEALLFGSFALVAAGRYRAAARFARLAVNRAGHGDEVARGLLGWALQLKHREHE